MSAHKLVQLRAIFENHEGWHGSNSTFLRNFRLVINIHLDKLDRTVLWIGGQPFKDWAYHSAWTTPWSPKVDYDHLARIDESLELGKASKARKMVSCAP